jgi:hypothetical protein
VVGRSRTCTPRVSSGRSTVRATTTGGGRGWTRNRLPPGLTVRQALSQLSYPPSKLRDKDSNLDLHVQSVASFRLRRSRIGGRRVGAGERPAAREPIPRLRPSPGKGARRSSETARSVGCCLLCHARPNAERCFPSHSPTLRPWITGRFAHVRAGRRPTWRGFGARSSLAAG